MIKICKKCGEEFEDVYLIDGKYKKRDNRVYCYVCHPFRDNKNTLMGKCQTCGSNFEKYPMIDNKRRNLAKRRNCINCNPLISRSPTKFPKNTNKFKICKICGDKFEIKQNINGIKKELKNRVNCLKCIPFNTSNKNHDILNYELNDIQKQILDGHLLGDGTVHKNNSKNACLQIFRMIEDEEYLRWTANHFKDLTTEKSIGYRTLFDKAYDNKERHAIRFTTRYCPAFTDYYNKWYPEGKKVVPRDLLLTPLVIAIWIADDGCILKTHNTRNYSDSFQLTLSTQGFKYDDVVFLMNSLRNIYGDRVNISKSGINKLLQDQFIIFSSHTETVCNIISDLWDYFPPINRKLEEIKYCKLFKIKENDV